VDRALAILATLAVGALVAFQPPANSQLGRSVGTLGAAFISVSISFLIVTVILLVSGGAGQLSGLADFRPAYLLGGVAGAAVVTVTLVTVRTLGAGGVVAVTVCTQLIGSAILDRFGVLGLDRTALTPTRLLGFALLIAGTVLVVSR
jgi:bacterial/archaeal transporter family-2 protein